MARIAARKTKVAVTLDRGLPGKVARARRTRLARECAKLEPEDEKALAEEGLAGSSSARAAP